MRRLWRAVLDEVAAYDAGKSLEAIAKDLGIEDLIRLSANESPLGPSPRAIEALRREIAARDGSAFDLRAFHDAVLGHGSMPLATLRSELPTWVATPA